MFFPIHLRFYLYKQILLLEDAEYSQSQGPALPLCTFSDVVKTTTTHT